MPDLFDARPVTLDEQRKAVDREIQKRLHVYPRLVGQGKMTQAQATREVAAMRAVADTLADLAKRESRQ
jgi:uncharacterized Zn finger protein (UPF0148 family)